mgnify:CR=1 FL=1
MRGEGKRRRREGAQAWEGKSRVRGGTEHGSGRDRAWEGQSIGMGGTEHVRDRA